MVASEKTRAAVGDCTCWTPEVWRTHRGRRIRFAILLVLMGLVWLGSRAGWFDHALLGPLMVTLVGAWLVVVAMVKRRRMFSPRGTGDHLVTKGEVRHEQQWGRCEVVR